MAAEWKVRHAAPNDPKNGLMGRYRITTGKHNNLDLADEALALSALSALPAAGS